jgi:hypothetical protein
METFLISAGLVPMMISSTSQVSPPVACVSSPASSSALADMRELHQQWHLALWVFLDHSLDQPFVGKSLSGHAVNETIEPRQSMVFDVAFVAAGGREREHGGTTRAAG